MNKISVWSLVLVVVFVATSISGCSDSKKESQKLVNVAKQYIDKRNLRAATIELKNSLQEDANNGEARFLLGKIYLETGDISSAEKELRRAKNNNWNKELVQLHLAESLLRQQKYQEFLKEIAVNKAFSTSAQANLLGMKAIAQAGLDQKEKATKTFAEGQKVFKDARWVLQARIGRLMQEKQHESASKVLKQALAIYPDNQDMWLMTAENANIRGDDKASEAALKKVLELEPLKMMTSYGWQAHMGLTSLMLAQKDLGRAHAELKPLLKRNENDPQANYLAALIAYKQDNKDVAEAKLLKALKVAPEYQPARLLLGSIQYDKRNYEQSVYYLSQYITGAPSNLEARKLLGLSYIALGQQQEAQAILRAGIGNETDPELMALIGLSELQGGQKTAGIKDLKRAIKSAPDNLNLKMTLAKAYIANGETDNAIRELQQLQNNADTKFDAQRLQVLAHMRAGNLANAVTLAKTMLKSNPDNSSVMALLANVYVAMGERASARKYFEQALQTKPDDVAVVMSLARLDEIEGQLKAAKLRYQSVLEIRPDSAPAMFALARISSRLGEHEEVGEWLEKSSQAAPEELLPQVTLVQYYLRQNKVDKAELIVKQLVETNPHHISTLAFQGKIFMLRGKYNQALSPLRELVKIAPKSVVGSTLLGEALIGVLSLDDASKEFEKVLKIQPNSVIALNNLAWLYDQKKDPRALEYAKKAYELNPENPSIQDTYGWILVQTGKVNEGYILLEEASEKLPKVEEVSYHLAVAKLELGQKNEARAILQELVNSGKDFNGKENAQLLLKE